MQKLPDSRPNKAQIEENLILNNSRTKVARDLNLLPNYRYREITLISIHLQLSIKYIDREYRVEFDLKLPFLGKNRKSGKSEN